MSKNIGPEELAQEFAALQKVMEPINPGDQDSAIILARIVHGLSSEDWKKASKDYPLSQWQALPLADSEETEVTKPKHSTSLPVSPFREAQGLLTKATFLNLLKRELLRLGRIGGSLSIIGAALANRQETTTALGVNAVGRLEDMLGRILLANLEACDGISLASSGAYLCSLPGLGQLAARRFAEKASEEFIEEARPFFPAGGIGAGQGCACAMGIVNILPGDVCNAKDLIKRAKATLEIALAKPGSRIHQETAVTPLSGPTLVHSSEKRFLFFGGDPA